MMTVWLVNPFDTLPGEALSERRYAFLARLLSEMGYQVIWWSSNFSHRLKRQRDIDAIRSALGKGITVELLDTPHYKSNVSIQRLLNHRAYARQFVKRAQSYRVVPDVIIASTPPLESAWASIKVARRLGAKAVIDVQDLLPEAFQLVLPAKIRGIAKLVFYPFKKWEDRIFQKSHALSAVSQDYLRRALEVQNSSKPSAVVHLGIDLQYFDRVASLDTFSSIEKGGKEFWVIYVGNLGSANDLETVLFAADLAQKEGLKNLKFLFAGTGEMLSTLQGLSYKFNLSNTLFLGWLSYEDMVQVLVHSDVAANVIKPASMISFPNKVFDYFAAGLPIINSIAGGELELLMKEKNIGLQYTAGDKESLFNAIKSLYYDKAKRRIMGANARRLTENVFDRNIEYQKIIELIKQVTAI